MKHPSSSPSPSVAQATDAASPSGSPTLPIPAPIPSLRLSRGEASAVLLPHRGGLLSELSLTGPTGEATQLLWLPDAFAPGESGWPGGGMPLLFPFAGRVFHSGQALHYQVGDKLLHMPLHGFGYAQPWEVLSVAADSAELQLRNGPRTQELFPFDFRVRARYTLREKSLETQVTVENLGAHLATYPNLPVALGWHPYFCVAGNEGAYLETSATAKTRVTPAGGAGKTTPFPENAAEQAARLSDPFLHNLILGPHTAPSARLVWPQKAAALRLNWSDYSRYLVLWTQPGQGFHCLEPWMGLPDALHNGDGLRWLAPGESLSYELSLVLEAL